MFKTKDGRKYNLEQRIVTANTKGEFEQKLEALFNLDFKVKKMALHSVISNSRECVFTTFVAILTRKDYTD